MNSDDGMLSAPYRPVRAVRAREDSPWPGVLARDDEGAVRLLVDADDLGPDWSGWDADPDGHVLAPLDIARRRDGHDVVLPVCVERLDDFLRRREARLPLTPGEAVTLGVSLLRGAAQLAASPPLNGEWWLDEGGRPVLATDASPRRALDATAEAMSGLVVGGPLQRTWDTALRAITAERLSTHDLVAAEDALFALAPAEPLSTTSLSPRPVADVPLLSHPRPATAESEPPTRTLWNTLLHGVDDDLADAVSRTTTAVWRRLGGRQRTATARSGARRAPWIVGGAVAAAVLAVGAFWPGGGPATADGSAKPARSASAAASPPADGSPSEDVGDPPASDDATDVVEAGGEAADLVAITAGLLQAKRACGDETSCLAAVLVDPAAPPSAGAIDLDAEATSITLLDDFGDLAVLRVDARDGAVPSQLVVILHHEEKWLLRDVHDVAQQP